MLGEFDGDWSLSIKPVFDTVRIGREGIAAICNCGYSSKLQEGPDAAHRAAMAAMQHITHAHSRKPGDPELDMLGIEVVETKTARWAWRCHVCDEQEFQLLDEATAQERANDHGRQYRHHRRVSRGTTAAVPS
jgi:hypothetical protein